MQRLSSETWNKSEGSPSQVSEKKITTTTSTAARPPQHARSTARVSLRWIYRKPESLYAPSMCACKPRGSSGSKLPDGTSTTYGSFHLATSTPCASMEQAELTSMDLIEASNAASIYFRQQKKRMRQIGSGSQREHVTPTPQNSHRGPIPAPSMCACGQGDNGVSRLTPRRGTTGLTQSSRVRPGK